MSDPAKQHKRDKLKDTGHKVASKIKKWAGITPKPTPTPSPQPSRSPTPAPYNGEGPPPGATAINPESTPSRVDNGEDSSKGGDTVKTDTPDTAQSKPDPDWQAWKIDDKSISQLRDWGTGQENSKWRKLADKIDHCLNSKTSEALQEFIPDSPFPAKTLVKALLSIVQLGINIPRIQKEVYEFAQDAIEYIRTLVEVAGEEPTAKKYLESICEEVNKICKWARDHVRKITLSAGDLGDWNSKFEKAKALFLTKAVLQIQVQQATEERKKFVKDKLATHVAAMHTYTDQGKGFCADNTRVEIQEEIRKWLSPQTSSSEHIFWITGIAGSGKSTLSATVAETLRKNHTPVAAQFFISRNLLETIKPEKIIPTIAQQLSELSPVAARIIQDTLKDGFPSSWKEQVEALLLAPIRELCKSRDVVIIIIDALDELDNPARSIKEILSPIATSNLPNNIRFIITSRPDGWADDIAKTLESVGLKQCALKTESSREEVKNFVAARMKDITLKQSGPGWENWPPPRDLQKLCNQADGLFHYAGTALHWIEAQIDEHGRACRGWVLENLTPEGGLGQLEDLYRVILTSFEDINKPARNAGRRKVRLAGFQHVIGTILVLQESLTIHQITAILADISENDFDVVKFLQQFRSVLIPGNTASFEEAQPQMHKSFRDYIMGERAPPVFRIHTGEAHLVTARSCLEVIVKAGSSSDAAAEYAVAYWCQHLRKAVEGDADFGDEGGIWDLFKRMKEDTVVGVWKENAKDVFCDVAAAGWKLLQKTADKHRMEGILAIVGKAKELWLLRRGLENNWWDLLDLEDEEEWWERRLLLEDEELRAFPLSPVLASLTVHHLLISSGKMNGKIGCGGGCGCCWNGHGEFLTPTSGKMASLKHGNRSTGPSSSGNPTPKDQEDRLQISIRV